MSISCIFDNFHKYFVVVIFMMNYLWPTLILLSIVYAFLTQNTTAVSDAVFSSLENAVTLTLKMLGMLCFWSGMMQLAEKSGLTEKIARALSPLLRRLFPEIKNDKDAQSAISMNITANLFGIGNAATPLGIEAMKRLKKHAPTSDTASNAMVLFVVLNAASIKLIPTTVAMLRHDAGSGAPMEILPVSLLVSFASCTAAIVAAKLLERRSNG